MRLKNRKVLVVDDEPDYLDILREDLEFEGAIVITASGGIEALEQAKLHSDLCAIVSDTNMPRGNGLELLKSISALRPQLAFFLVHTASNSTSYREAEALGARSLISKPFDMELLVSKIEEVVNEK